MPRYRRNYPRDGADVLDNAMRFKRVTRRAIARFARSRPWRGTSEERCRKFRTLHNALCRIYHKNTALVFMNVERFSSGYSSYSPQHDTITLMGRLSVVTYLHEFAHALGRDERGACRWSLNLFKRLFPRSFRRCRFCGHMLVQSPGA